MALHLESRAVAVWTLFSSFALLVFSIFMMSAGNVFFAQFPYLVTGRYHLIHDAPYGSVLAVCCAATASAVMFSFIACATVAHVIKRPLPATILQLKQNFNFYHFFVLTAIEEIVRWLFIYVLPQHLPGGAITFYFCLIGGSIAWLFFRNRYFFNQPPNTLFLYPQFVVSFFYAFILLKYGIVAAYMVHLATKSFLLMLHKVEDSADNPNRDKDLKMGVVALVYGIVSFAYLGFVSDKTPWDVGQWLNRDSFEIDGWDFFDYLAASTGFIYLVKAATFFFYFDQGSVRTNGKPHDLPIPGVVMVGCSGLALLVGLGYLALSAVIPSVQIKALLTSILVCSFYHPNSGSGRVRNFWFVLLVVFMALCVIQTVAWYWAIAYLALNCLLYLPFLLLERQSVQQA